MTYCITHFEDKSTGMFFFTSDEDKALISRKMELSDNVIPASNSCMAKNLFKLGHHFENDVYLTTSRKMLNNIIPEMINYGAGYSNWAMLLLYFSKPFYEIAIVGKTVEEKRKEFNNYYFTNKIFAGSKKSSALPLLKNRTTEETSIYVCANNTCYNPVKSISEAMTQIEKKNN
jgi:uncharacterized protein YyaL (SSP411 family)